MAYPLHTPRVNNNDDIVQLVELNVSKGDLVKNGQIVGAVETDKALVDVEADRDGYVLKILPEQNDKIAVGSVLMWIGHSPDEPVPERTSQAPAGESSSGVKRPTAKAAAMLAELGLSPDRVPVSAERLTVADVEAYLASEELGANELTSPPCASGGRLQAPEVSGELHELSAEAHGMLLTVLWHRDEVAPAYLELEYDPKPWDLYAADFAQQHQLMLSPLLPLLAYRLVEIARDRPKINATIVNDRRYVYSPVNLGFTVQAGETLYLAVVREANTMDAARFISALGEVQRHAMAHKLRADEASGATIGFSSMARWNISRHVPILPPHTGLMLAHAAPRESGKAVLGASYDHRLLSGYEVAKVLQDVSQPPSNGLK